MRLWLIFISAINLLCFFVVGQQNNLSSRTSNALQLCDTSATQSVANSGYAGITGTRFTSVSCDPVQNAMIVKIFNSVGSIYCANQGHIDSTTFTVFMKCSGKENNGNGVTGSLTGLIQNGKIVQHSAGISLQVSGTSDSLIVALDDPNVSISGRTCTIDLYADLWAQETSGGECYACLNRNILQLKQQCGYVEVDDDSDENWTDKSYFWIILESVLLLLAAAAYMGYLIWMQQNLHNLWNSVNNPTIERTKVEMEVVNGSKPSKTTRPILNRNFAGSRRYPPPHKHGHHSASSSSSFSHHHHKRNNKLDREEYYEPDKHSSSSSSGNGSSSSDSSSSNEFDDEQHSLITPIENNRRVHNKNHRHHHHHNKSNIDSQSQAFIRYLNPM